MKEDPELIIVMGPWGVYGLTLYCSVASKCELMETNSTPRLILLPSTSSLSHKLELTTLRLYNGINYFYGHLYLIFISFLITWLDIRRNDHIADVVMKEKLKGHIFYLKMPLKNKCWAQEILKWWFFKYC